MASLTAAAQTSESDTQSWNEIQYTIPISKRLDLILGGELRLTNNLSRLGEERVGAGLKYKAWKYLDAASEYEYIAQQTGGGGKSYEHRLSFSGTGKLPLPAKITLENRHQIQRRIRHSTPDSTRYRLRLLASRPFAIGGREIELFISDEIFYDYSRDAWTRNRFSVGGEKALTDRLSLEIYYLRQNDSFARPGDLHVIGTTIKVK